jgi:hypothetical protein
MKVYQLSICLLFLQICVSCKKEQGPSGLKSLVNLTTISTGSECGNGGVKIESGVDLNGNNVLDPSEITDAQTICNGVAGTNGYTSLIRTSNFASNSICAAGGLQIETGLDSNFNGILDNSEVQQTQQLCNGINGAYDKQIGIVLNQNGAGWGQTSPYIFRTPTLNFNIDNFPGVDSAVFFAGNMYVYHPGDTIYFKLYDFTDNTPFENTLLYGSTVQPISKTSTNIINDLPKKSIDLGIEEYVNSTGAYGMASYFYLVLYRK